MDVLERHAAELGIRAAKARYVQGADTQDWELFASSFSENGEWDLRGNGIARHPVTGEWNSEGCSVGLEVLEGLDTALPWPIHGRDSIREALESGSGDYVGFHQLSSPHIEILSDTTAKGTWHLHDVLHYPEGGPFRTFSGWGYYHETYVREDGTWLIDTCRISRVIVHIP